MTHTKVPQHVEVEGALSPGFDEILTAGALAFLADLARRFGPPIETALERRRARRRSTIPCSYGYRQRHNAGPLRQ